MKRPKLIVSTIAIGLTAAALAGSARAAAPTQADIDFCNQQAMLSRSAPSSTPGSSNTGARQPGQIGAGATRGPDQPAAQGMPGSTTSPRTSGSGSLPGGTNSSATSPGTPSSGGAMQSAPGMSAVGQSDTAYRQAYVDCLRQRVK